MNNPIIQEVRLNREALATQFDFDLHCIIENAIQSQSKKPTVNRQQPLSKRLQPTETD